MRFLSHLHNMAIVGLLCAFLPAIARADKPTPFYLHNGDRVVFYGDSITEQRRYTTYIETYCVAHFPKEHFTFINSGWGGDRVTGGGGGPIDLRLKRDVLAYKPTVVTICLGMNDAGYRPFSPQLYQTFIQGYRHIIETLEKNLPGVRITLLTAPAYDDVTRPPNFPGGYNSVLTAFNEGVKELAREYHLVLADTNAPLVSLLARAIVADPKLAPTIIPDRVHPDYSGHLIMASAVLLAWNAPSTVADVEIDADSGQLTHAENTHITHLQTTNGTVSFDETDNSLPWPFDRDPNKNPATLLALSCSDVENELNRYQLKVTGLTAAAYTLKVDGQNVAQLTPQELAQGIDLAALPMLPTCAQAQKVLDLANRHVALHFQRWRVVQVPNANGLEVPPAIQQQMDALDSQEAEVVAQERLAALPTTHHVELVPSTTSPSP